MVYMLDTNICIYLLRGQAPKVIARLEEQDVGSVVMSCLTLAELRHGVERQPVRVRKSDTVAMNALLRDIPALDFDKDAAHAFGVLASGSKLKRNQAVDNLIAAHAISLQAVLVTNNGKDFKGYPGLVVENWA